MRARPTPATKSRGGRAPVSAFWSSQAVGDTEEDREGSTCVDVAAADSSESLRYGEKFTFEKVGL